MNRIYYFLLVIAGLFSCQEQSNEFAPDLEDFQIQDGFEITLMAIEPLISDPVDMEIDEYGRWYVVQMHGYPLDVSGSGVVKRLTDTDDDGVLDKSTVFIDSLVLPTGIMRWKNGFLVTDPPNVLYIEDTDDDGRADVRETLLTGFAVSNPQHNVNNPIFGLDNWIYLSHEGAISTKTYSDVFGDKGSAVLYPGIANSPSLPRNAYGLAVRFKPDSGQVEMLSSNGQYGHTFDPWGNHFFTSNADHLFHEALPAAYIQRNKDLGVSSGRQYIPKNGKGFGIYPITENQNHQLLTDIGMMTSACGILWYQGGIFPSAYDNVIFSAEPVHNMIHADIVQRKGATFESINMLENEEFLASKDAWFRPVNHYIGPDGAMYVLDYYRKVIEHPEWLSEETIQAGELYEGIDKGRIYRIAPKGTATPGFIDKLNLSAKTSGELIQLLEHKNIWWRTHAQRLLMDRQEGAIATELIAYLNKTNSPVGKVHALWLLEGKGAITSEIILDHLNDSNHQVRIQAIKLAEARMSNAPELVDKLLSMKNDSKTELKYQLLLTLGYLKGESAEQARAEILFQHLDDKWFHDAALSADDVNLANLYEGVRNTVAKTKSESSEKFIRRLIGQMAKTASTARLNAFLANTLKQGDKNWYSPVVLEGIATILRRRQNPVLKRQNIAQLESLFKQGVNDQIRTSGINLLHADAYFTSTPNKLKSLSKVYLQSNEVGESLRSDAVRVLGYSAADENSELFASLINGNEAKVRMAAIKALGTAKGEAPIQLLLSLWPGLIPKERSEAVSIMLRSDEGRLSLLNAIKEKKVQANNLIWSQKVHLLNNKNDEIRRISRAVLQSNQLDSDSVWSTFKIALSMDGSSTAGADAFKNTCGICHQKSGKNGIAFGPDLASVQSRSKSALMLDILQPNRSIADGFELWQAELSTGDSFSGVITYQGPTSITLRDMAGNDKIVNRADIKTLKALETSAMPENLHLNMTPTDMANLLAYLKNI
ncbi:MAG: c-type cytochrome [Cyclobacteriaceae bacterium]